MTDTLAIVVTYNRREKLKKNLASLLSQTHPCDVLVIDNASSDGTGEMVKSLGNEKIFYLNTGKNLGGAGGFSFGVREGYRRGYGHFWMMDDDCMPEKNALEEFWSADGRLHGNYGFLSGIAYFTDGALCNMNVQKTGLKEKISDFSSPEVEIIMATFVSLFFSRETVREFGLPIKEFFIWSDDLEYTRRISREKKCYAIPSSKCVHEMASNEKVNIAVDSPERLPRYRYLYRNEVYVYRREGWKGWAYLFSRLFLHTARILLRGNGKRFRKIGIVWGSFFRGFSFRPEIEFPEEKK